MSSRDECDNCGFWKGYADSCPECDEVRAVLKDAAPVVMQWVQRVAEHHAEDAVRRHLEKEKHE